MPSWGILKETPAIATKSQATLTISVHKTVGENTNDSINKLIKQSLTNFLFIIPFGFLKRFIFYSHGQHGLLVVH